MSKLDELEKLARLKKSGILTNAEFEEQKEAILNGDGSMEDDNSTNTLEFPCDIKCDGCSYKGRMNYQKYRMSAGFWVYFLCAFFPTFYIAMFISLIGGIILAALVGIIARLVFDFVVEIDTYTCPKCGKSHEVLLKNADIKTLRQHKLYHKKG